MRLSRSLIAALTVALMLLLAGCGGSATPTPIVIPVEPTEPSYIVMVRSDPFPYAVGSATLIVTVTTGDDSPVTGLTVSARGDMTHAGMAPVLGDGTEGDPGVYSIPWEWTMAGDWLIDITLRAPDGTEVVQTIDAMVES